jgi:ectoine hydroxylase-related dioxygenase (phytanoyl-CoA dioxygenase family)
MNPLVTTQSQQGWCVLPRALEPDRLARLLSWTDRLVDSMNEGVRRSEGAVYAARNVVQVIPDVVHEWRSPMLVDFVRQCLGPEAGLVRILFFDKPPEQTWALPWHKDLLIATEPFESAEGYSPPRPRAGVPHTEPPLSVLESMVTLRLHLDEITLENGPLRVASGTHRTGKTLLLDGFEQHTICTAAGDVLVMSPLLVHCSGSSDPATKRHRRILHLEFSRTRDLPGGVRWHFWSPVGTVP